MRGSMYSSVAQLSCKALVAYTIIIIHEVFHMIFERSTLTSKGGALEVPVFRFLGSPVDLILIVTNSLSF